MQDSADELRLPRVSFATPGFPAYALFRPQPVQPLFSIFSILLPRLAGLKACGDCVRLGTNEASCAGEVCCADTQNLPVYSSPRTVATRCPPPDLSCPLLRLGRRRAVRALLEDVELLPGLERLAQLRLQDLAKHARRLRDPTGRHAGRLRDLRKGRDFQDLTRDETPEAARRAETPHIHCDLEASRSNEARSTALHYRSFCYWMRCVEGA